MTKKPTPTKSFDHGNIEVIGAQAHNLQNIDVDIPRNKLVVITGVSGSGKSSLAFDTIYAEGQRRYLETFSAYARQFIGEMERPEVEKINGLSPVISIEQKTVSRNPRSTVGTITEVYDFLRLLFARTADAYSHATGEKMVRYTEEQMLELIMTKFKNKKTQLLAPVVRGRKGHYRELFEQVRKQGYTKVRVDGKVLDLVQGMKVDRYKTHDIEVVIDRIKIAANKRDRLSTSLRTALKMGDGLVFLEDIDTNELIPLSSKLMDAQTGIAYEEPSPNTFSFNSPYGACPRCKGLGSIYRVDMDTVIPDYENNIKKGGIVPLGEARDNTTFKQLKAIAKKFKFSFSTPIKDIPEEALQVILHGGDRSVDVSMTYGKKKSFTYTLKYDGVVNMVENWFTESSSEKIRRWAESFMILDTCPDCKGYRLKQEALHFKLGEQHIGQLAEMETQPLYDWVNGIAEKMTDRQRAIGRDVIKELQLRLKFLLHVGLDYLSLNRPARSLSGGEAQRIRLATQIGSQLTGITYILDEPSIGLHQRDNQRLIEALHQLSDIGNTVLVVEHDKDIMLAADYLIDLGPGAGEHGGKIVAAAAPKQFLKLNSPTALFLKDKEKIEVPKKRREGTGEFLTLFGATGNNLKKVDLRIPLGKLVCVTGVSGSGKSTLIHETLYPILRQHFYKSIRHPLAYERIEGLEHIDKVIEIDQSPIGRTPRSNPATYTGVFTEIRSLYAKLPESMIRGYKPGRFSFNVKGGRCEECGGGGMRTIEMNFLPDVEVECERCQGRRYNRETLEILYKGKSINDVLEMSVEEAEKFFESIPKIYRKLKVLREVGLGYIRLGQRATTLSGGEAQRVKLSEELSKRATGQTLYILDEPTTGLHFQDIRQLLTVLNRLVDKGNTIIIIEHNMDVIKVADHIIDIGPEGGRHGGQIIAEGTPEKVARSKKGFTSAFLKEELR